MGKKRKIVLEELYEELYAGYQALARVTVVDGSFSEVGYEMGYLDGYADAMHQASWVLEGKPMKIKKLFPLHKAFGLREGARNAFRRREV